MLASYIMFCKQHPEDASVIAWSRTRDWAPIIGDPDRTRTEHAVRKLRMDIATNGRIDPKIVRELIETQRGGEHSLPRFRLNVPLRQGSPAHAGQGSARESQPMPKRLVRKVFDAERSIDKGSATDIWADLTGLIILRNSRGDVIFLRLRDPSGVIQLKLDKSNMDAENWDRAKRARPGDFATIKGPVNFGTGKFSAEVTVSVVDYSEMLHRDRTADHEIVAAERADLSQHSIQKQFFLARLRRRAVEHFTKREFDEFEPSFLSFESRGDLEALEVVFPGWGGRAHLAASPAPQLLEVLLRTGSRQVFCVSRCFSAALRDGYTSAESLILCAISLDASIDKLARIAEDAVKSIFSDLRTMPPSSLQAWLGTEHWSRSEITWESSDPSVSSPEVQFLNTEAKGPVRSILRVVWPPNFIVVEGHTSVLYEEVEVGMFTIHLERMVPLLRSLILSRLPRV